MPAPVLPCRTSREVTDAAGRDGTLIRLAQTRARRLLRQGVVGLLLLTWLTAMRFDEPARILRALGPPAPILVAILIEALGGEVPLLRPSVATAARIVVFAVIFVVSNNVIVSRVELALGYSLETSAYLGLIDSGIYMVTLQYAILTTFSYGGIGWGGVLAAAVTGVIVNVMGRKLALTRTAKERLAQRLASLSSIGKTVSLRYSTDELIPVVYAECGKVIDVTMFTIALFRRRDELCSVLRADDGTMLPSFRVSFGEALSSWVVENRRPLRLGSVDEERSLGLTAYDDGLPTESWQWLPALRDSEAQCAIASALRQVPPLQVFSAVNCAESLAMRARSAAGYALFSSSGSPPRS